MFDMTLTGIEFCRILDSFSINSQLILKFFLQSDSGEGFIAVGKVRLCIKLGPRKGGYS